MIRQAVRTSALSMAVGIANGCGHHAGLPPVAPPIALHIAPGAGFNLANAGTVYLIVNSHDVRDRLILPQLTEVVASELRAAAAIDLVVLADRGVHCPPSATWQETCDTYRLPLPCADPSSAVIFCELQELDPYPPLRVGLAMHVRRAEDGLPLTGVQGAWDGQTVPVAPSPWYSWFLPGHISESESSWDAVVESESATDLMRRAARDCVQALVSPAPAMRQAGTGSPVPPADEFFQPPALPPADISESEMSAPPAPRPSL
jgi:hypothetical protein